MNEKRRQLLLALLVVQSPFLSASCNLKDQPMFLESRRPANVPADATLVDQAKGGVWKCCTFDPQKMVNRCEIYNWGGHILIDEEFIPYDGGGPVPAAELRIPKYSPLAERDTIYLQNGRILLPRSQFERLKKEVDWLKGKRLNPY